MKSFSAASMAAWSWPVPVLPLPERSRPLTFIWVGFCCTFTPPRSILIPVSPVSPVSLPEPLALPEPLPVSEPCWAWVSGAFFSSWWRRRRWCRFFFFFFFLGAERSRPWNWILGPGGAGHAPEGHRKGEAEHQDEAAHHFVSSATGL